MSHGKLLASILGLALVISSVVGCSAPATVSAPPTATPTLELPTATSTPEPPTATPTQKPAAATATPTSAMTLATSAEEIVGTWRAGNYYIRFDEDGTYRQAHDLDKLDRRPYSINSYQFEGTRLVSTMVSVSGVPSCGKKVGIYEIQLLESGNIKIVTIKDECTGRRGDTAGEYEPVR